MNTDLIFQLLGPLGVGIGVYAAIRADLARTTVVAQHAHESAAEAHKRIDRITEK